MIYLDNAATTRVFDCAVNAASEVMREQYFNPNATYKSGVLSRERIEMQRRNIAERIGALPQELIFTSCATESNNWVFSCGVKNKKGNIVISAGEHSSVYEPAMRLKSQGADVRIAPLNKDGTVNELALIDLIDSNTTLVSVIHVSNETGVVNNIKRISDAVKAKAPRALIHSDGVQGFLKLDTPIRDLGVDFYSAGAHKIGGPKGIGLLYIKNGINMSPFISGGGQEKNMRSGTQNTPFIAAFSAAVDEFIRLKNTASVRAVRAELCDYFNDNGCKIIGDGENSGYILCVCIPDVKAEILQNAVHDRGVVIGKGAACSGSKRGNRVLEAMGLSPKEIERCIRISLFVDTEKTAASNAAKIIIDTAKQLGSKHVK